MERHGKRKDMTGQSRAINDAPPVTTTGLDVHALFESHIAGAFVPKAHSKAMHIVIQFPTDLVDGNDAAGMLRHARRFIISVFGEAAIFADRVDRDEKNRHLVDLFVAPKYVKRTKHQAKEAVSMTHHLKALAEKYGEKTGPYGCARSLQTALFEYLRDDMKLPGVMRGKPKEIAGSDWVSSEQLRADELDELLSNAKIEHQQIQRDRKDVDRREAEVARRELAVQAADHDLNAAKAEIDNQRRELSIASAMAAHAVEIARDEAVAALNARVQAEADRATVEADRQAVAAERERIHSEQALRETQFGLLIRGADKDEGLNLAIRGNKLAVSESSLTNDELNAVNTPWPNPLIDLARRVAQMLQQARDLSLRLLNRENAVKAREIAVVASEAQSEQERVARASRHEKALAVLAAKENAAMLRIADADRKTREATKRETEAKTALIRQNRWSLAVGAIIDHPEWIDIVNNMIILDRNAAAEADPQLIATLREQPPTWAVNVVAARLEVADAQYRVNEQEKVAADSAEQLQEMISRAGKSLTPDQEKVVVEIKQTIHQTAWAAHARSTLGRE